MNRGTTSLIVFFYFAGLNCFATDSLAIKYSESILSKDLSKHLHIIASDSFQGRETGEIGQKMAAKYIAKMFESYKIPPLYDDENNPTYYQKVPIELLDPSKAKINVNGNKYSYINDFFFFNEFDDINLSKNKILFLGYGIQSDVYNDYKNQDVKDKILLILNGEPGNKRGKYLISGNKNPSVWSTNRKKKSQTAKKNGAAAIFIISENYYENLYQFGHYIKRPSFKVIIDDSEEKDELLPTFYVSPQMSFDIMYALGRKWLINKIKRKTYKKKRPQLVLIPALVDIDVNQEKKQIIAENVLGYIEGTDKKEELLIITAHYDHLGVIDGEVYNGADDDGSGTVALLEMAEAFTKAKTDGHGPRRSILFLPLVGEEKGLLGSKYYVNKPVFPIENTIANLNIDMIGRIDKEHFGNSNYVYLIGADKLSSELHNISSECNSNYTNLNLDYTYNKPDDPNRFYYRSDHFNFAEKNIPVIFFFTGIHEDYHKSTDTVDKIDFDKIEKITKLVFFTAWELANREDRIVVDKVPEE